MPDFISPELTACDVVCVGVNPAFDLTLTLDGLDDDRANRVTAEYCQAAGKAANVACVLAQHGKNAGLAGFYGEDNAAEWQRLFAERVGREIPLGMIICSGATRENITLLSSGKTVKINRPGCTVGENEIKRLEACLERCAGGTDGTKIAVFTGSLPPGLTSERYADLLVSATQMGFRVALDIDGLNREQLLKASPWLYKPNAHELARLTGAGVGEDDALISQAERLSAEGVGTVLLTLGARGLAAVDAQRTIRIEPKPVAAVNTVGAGDAALAAFIAAYMDGCAPVECARRAARCGEQAAAGRYTV